MSSSPAPSDRHEDAAAISREDWLTEQLEAQTANAEVYLERARRAERALQRIFGLLTARRWWNDNVWAAREIARDVLLGGDPDAR